MGKVRDFLVGAMYHLIGLVFGPVFRPSRGALDPKRILVLKPCCIGDVLMSTALVGELRRAFPEARLDFAVGPWSRETVSNNPNIDKLLDCGPVGSGRPFGWKDYWSLVGRIRNGNYDACFVLERSALLALIPFFARVPNRIGINSGGRGFSLTVKVPWNSMRHEAELYLDLLRALGVQPANPRLEFLPSKADNAWAEERLKSLTGPDGKRVPLVAIFAGGAANPGMTLPAKRWLPDRYALLAKRFLSVGWGVVLVGAVDDKLLAEHLINTLRSSRMSERVVDLSGETSLGQLGGVYKSCDLFIGNDTGPMHLAVACSTPVVAIFGPSTPEMYGPFGTNTRAVYKPVDCSPCFLKGRFAADCSHHKCMEAIEVEDVWLAATSLVMAPARLQGNESGDSIG